MEVKNKARKVEDKELVVNCWEIGIKTGGELRKKRRRN